MNKGLGGNGERAEMKNPEFHQVKNRPSDEMIGQAGQALAAEVDAAAAADGAAFLRRPLVGHHPKGRGDEAGVPVGMTGIIDAVDHCQIIQQGMIAMRFGGLQRNGKRTTYWEI